MDSSSQEATAMDTNDSEQVAPKDEEEKPWASITNTSTPDTAPTEQKEDNTTESAAAAEMEDVRSDTNM